MFYALTWIVVFALLALWSLTAWALHAAASWALANAGTLAGAAPDAAGLQLPAWLAPWVPPEVAAMLASWAAGLAPLVEWLLGLAPVLGDMLPVVTWGMWGIGSVLLLAAGGLAHAVVAFVRRRSRHDDDGRPKWSPAR